MKKFFLAALTLFFCATFQYAFAQREGMEVRMFVTEFNGELIGTGELVDTIMIYAKKPTAKEMRLAQKKLEKFDKMRWNVHKVYPYAVGVATLLKEVDEQTKTMTSEPQKKAFLEKKQKELFADYEDDIRAMTTSQGKILVKLIHRQTGKNAYSLIKDTRSGTTAFFWNGIGSLFGINLKAEIDPEEDGLIEQFAHELDYGGYNIVYQQANYRVK